MTAATQQHHHHHHAPPTLTDSFLFPVTTSPHSSSTTMTVAINTPPTVGINGFGRIGRALFRICLDREDIRLVAVNHTAASIEHLLCAIRHDSTHGTCRHSSEITVAPAHHPEQLAPTATNPTPSALLYRGRIIHLFSQRDPANLDWSSAGADYIMESTGKMTTTDSAAVHISAAKAKKVIISAPSKDARNIVFGVNHSDYAGEDVVSNASCTTNCLAPVASVLHKAFGVETGMMTTIHASTASQKVLDGFSSKDMRSGRSAMGNIIPATTGAAKAVVKVLPELAGKFQGISVRVPVTNVSLVDLTVTTTRPFADKDALMAAFETAANTPVSEGGLKGVLGYSEEKLVSSDYLTSSQSSIIDVDASIVLNDHTAKVVAWYDNEYGFASRMCDLAIYMASRD